ncbi:hypothetical protein ZIOFF_060249 [Zingiber officinale]|uniref:RNase H type-1 domain-containing protein n=1 Tax=Zingiber officinale TaxID=94328 RepID=A0A8J5KHL6_ZINOF|nr:hypothetical protein ZIOFF_060249 [Zingiber officinale]
MDHILRLISSEENLALLVLPTMEEVKQVVWEMCEDSVAGPNGFSVAFYVACWEIIKLDVHHVVFDFFQGGSLPKDVLPASMAAEVAEISVQQGGSDCLIWKLSVGGRFSMKSAWNHIRQGHQPVEMAAACWSKLFRSFGSWKAGSDWSYGGHVKEVLPFLIVWFLWDARNDAQHRGIKPDRPKVVMVKHGNIGFGSNVRAELMAILKDLELCVTHHFFPLCLESDSLVALKMINTSWVSREACNLVLKIRELILKFQVLCSHVFREANAGADYLANQAFNIPVDSVLFTHDMDSSGWKRIEFCAWQMKLGGQLMVYMCLVVDAYHWCIFFGQGRLSFHETVDLSVRLCRIF